MPWTTEQVLALAPDASSAKSGKDLSAPRKWETLGATEACAWGSIQGSGKDPYQACIDLSGPAFKCTCPSRKFPCKHGLGLFLILAQQPAALSEKQLPPWAEEWLAKRVEKETKKQEKASTPETRTSPEDQAKAAAAAQKRAATREARVSSGLEDLGNWLNDMVRSGFATLPGKPSAYWETTAARLVDSQAPGMARRVRDLDGITATGDGWPARLLQRVSLLHLAREGWTRQTELPVQTLADLRATVGFVTSQEEVLKETLVRDLWLVAAQRVEVEDTLRVQRTWMFGVESKRPAMCLSFSASPNQPLDISLVVGTTIDAELCFFPSAWPLRAVVKQRHETSQSPSPALPHADIGSAMTFASQGFAANPWLERVPLGLAQVTPQRRGDGWIVRDSLSQSLPLRIPEAKAWVLAALSGGKPIALAGEWDGESFQPLSVWAEGRFLRV